MRTAKTIGLTLFLGILLHGCGGAETEEKKEVIKPIKFGMVESVGGLSSRTFNGITQSGSETNLSFRTGGMITKLNVSVGQRVNKGQLLAQLDQKDALLALGQAELDVNNAKVQLETAQSAFDRTKKLYQTNNASLSDYEQAKSGLSNAQSGYEISLKRYDLQKSQVSYTSMYAPMTGIVSMVNAGLNEVAGAGQPILVMSQEETGDMEAMAGVPEKYISQVKQGSSTTVRIPSQSGEFSGVITEVGYSSTGGTYPVTVTIENPTEEVRPGMPVEVTFTFGDADQESQLVVPAKAVGEDENGQFVFGLNPKEDEVYEAQKMAIEVGSLTSGGFIVRSGIEQDQIVATAGLRTLYDGMKVKLVKL